MSMHPSKILLSFFAPLGKPSRCPIIGCIWKGSLRRLSTHATEADERFGRRWTAEENRKLESLFKQGFGTVGIMKQMKDRSYAAITHRVLALKRGRALVDEVTGRKTRPWSAEEDALMAKKLEQGLTAAGLASYFPDRSPASVRTHSRRLKLGPDSRRKKSNEFPDGRVQLIVDRKLNEAKTLAEIASELGLSYAHVLHLWRSQCTPTMPKEMLDTFRWRRTWSPNEMDRLLELQRRGTLCLRDAALQFPSKTYPARQVLGQIHRWSRGIC